MLDKEYVHLNGSWLRKHITVGKLKELLKDLDDNLLVYPNSVGDLSIARSEEELHPVVGVICISLEELITL